MAAPNLIGATTINGKTTGTNLTTANATTVLNNAVSSGKCLKVNTVNACNYTAALATITVSYYNAANVGYNMALVLHNNTNSTRTLRRPSSVVWQLLAPNGRSSH